jgi:hypothetical protein
MREQTADSVETERSGTNVLTVSGLCMCEKCTSRTTDIYRMVGYCLNCRARPILGLFRSGDKAIHLDCPACGNHSTVHWWRLATDDEFPEALVGSPGAC